MTTRKGEQVGAAGLAAVAVAYGFARYGYGLFLPALRAEFGLSTAWLGTTASASYAAYVGTLLLTAGLVARAGPRFPVVAGGLSAAIGSALVATADDPTVLAAGVIVAATSPGWSWTPFSDAVDRLLPEDRQSRTLAVISTGTTFGLLTAGPVALLVGDAWRSAWLAFAVAAIAVTAWNAWVLRGLPPGRDARPRPRLRWSWFVCPRSRPLFIVAFVLGLVPAFYFTYAVDLVTSASPARDGSLLWTVIGGAGLTGLVTGRLVERAGPQRVLAATSVALAGGVGLLAAAPGSPIVVTVSAVLYGAAYMPLCALLAIWSAQVFAAQPATGLSATMLVLSLGSIVGPALGGVVATRIGLGTSLLLASGLLVPLGLLRPEAPVRRAEPVHGR